MGRMIRALFKGMLDRMRDHHIWEEHARSDERWIDVKCSCGGGARIILEQKCGCLPVDGPWCGHMPDMQVLSATCGRFTRFAKRNGQVLAPPTEARVR